MSAPRCGELSQTGNAAQLTPAQGYAWTSCWADGLTGKQGGDVHACTGLMKQTIMDDRILTVVAGLIVSVRITGHFPTEC
jgi:hypothetical protein